MIEVHQHNKPPALYFVNPVSVLMAYRLCSHVTEISLRCISKDCHLSKKVSKPKPKKNSTSFLLRQENAQYDIRISLMKADPFLYGPVL